MAKATKAAKAAARTAAQTTAPALPAIGSVFTVTEIAELEEGRRLIARYLPAFPDAKEGDPVPTYRVTERNQAFVAERVASGIVTLVGVGAAGGVNALGTGRGGASGTVRT